MALFGMFKGSNKETVQEKLAHKIYLYSLESGQLIYNSPELVNQEDVTERGLILGMYHFTFFYVHYASRYILSRYGVDRRNEIIDSILPMIEKKYMDNIFKGYNTNDRENLEKLFSALYNVAEESYSKCNSLMYENSSLAARMVGDISSNSLIASLSDHLNKSFFGNSSGQDLLFSKFVETLVVKTCEAKELEALIDRI